jgi:hypothetical protein
VHHLARQRRRDLRGRRPRAPRARARALLPAAPEACGALGEAAVRDDELVLPRLAVKPLSDLEIPARGERRGVPERAPPVREILRPPSREEAPGRGRHGAGRRREACPLAAGGDPTGSSSMKRRAALCDCTAHTRASGMRAGPPCHRLRIAVLGAGQAHRCRAFGGCWLTLPAPECPPGASAV